MKRGSMIGPIVLIGIGVLFLLHNIRPELPVLDVVGAYWPYLLVAWGALRFLEITYRAAMSQRLPVHGVSGGEWGLVVLICLLGTGLYHGTRFARNWPQARITIGGLEIFGESFDFVLAEQKAPAGAAPRILIENLRGSVRIVGADTDQVTATGRNTVRAFNRQLAEKVSGDCALEMVRQGELIVVRTNQERAEGPVRVSADLELTVPLGTRVEGRGRSANFDLSELGGEVQITSDEGDVRLANIGSAVRLDVRRSGLLRAVDLKGPIEVKGGGSDVELENVAGPATILGSYSGELVARGLEQGLQFQSGSTELRIAKVPGQVRLRRGDLDAENVTGPVFLRATSKDVTLIDATEAIDVSVQRGDIELRTGRPPLPRIDARTMAGNIRFAAPPAGRFQLKATAERGEIENEYGGPFRLDSTEGGRSELTGSYGAGPEVLLLTRRGTISVRKAASEVSASSPQDRITLEVEKQ